MLNDHAFDTALRVFNRTRANVVECLRAAIEAFRREEMHQFSVDHADSLLQYSTADTDAGPDTALVITGFRDISELECFVAEKFKSS